MSDYRYYQMTVAEQNADVRWDSLTDIRNATAGLKWGFTSMVRARNKAEAEKMFRTNKRFRKMATQNQADWATVFVLVDHITKSEGIS